MSKSISPSRLPKKITIYDILSEPLDNNHNKYEKIKDEEITAGTPPAHSNLGRSLRQKMSIDQKTNKSPELEKNPTSSDKNERLNINYSSVFQKSNHYTPYIDRNGNFSLSFPDESSNFSKKKSNDRRGLDDAAKISRIQQEVAEKMLFGTERNLVDFCNDMENYKNSPGKYNNIQRLNAELTTADAKKQTAKGKLRHWYSYLAHPILSMEAYKAKQDYALTKKELTKTKADLEAHNTAMKQKYSALINTSVSANSSAFKNWLGGFRISPSINLADITKNLSLLEQAKTALNSVQLDPEKSAMVEEIFNKKIAQLENMRRKYPALKEYYSPVASFIIDAQHYHSIRKDYKKARNTWVAKYKYLIAQKNKYLKERESITGSAADVEIFNDIQRRMDSLKKERLDLGKIKKEMQTDMQQRYRTLYTKGSVKDQDFIEFLSGFQYEPNKSKTERDNYLRDVIYARKELCKRNPFDKNKAKAFDRFLEKQERLAIKEM